MSISAVSIIIPCYNQGKYLSLAIDSALAQRGALVQVIVVNDGSLDDTRQVAAKYKGQIDYVEQPNAGLAAARNRGIAEIRGEAVLFLDSDDHLAPDAAAHHINTLRSGSDVSYGTWDEVDPAGRVLRHAGVPDLGGDPFHTLLRHNPFPCHTVAVRAQVLRNVGEFHKQFPSCEDWDLWLRIAATGATFAPTPAALAFYHRYPGSMSRNYKLMWESGSAVIRHHARHDHPHCIPCAKAARDGVQRWRTWCVEQMLWPDIHATRAEKGNLPALITLARATFGDPAMMSNVFDRYLRPRLRRVPPLRKLKSLLSWKT